MNKKIYIIAEIAQGFEGKPEQARLLMKAAASANADAVKYQLVYAEELATPDYKYYDLFKSLEMSDEIWMGLAIYANELGIELNLDIFGIKSLNLAQKLNVTTVKLHGTDLTNLGLLQQVADSNVPRVLLGTGGGYLSEIEQALEILENKEVVVLAGFQGYPTSTDDNQIARVSYFYDKLCRDNNNIKIGFADHASPDSPLRYALATTAVGAGALIIEKHITLGQVMKLEDYESALNPDEFAEFTSVVNNCALACGKTVNADDFGMSDSEKGYREMIRRHVVSSKDISAGSVITPRDLVLKRTSSTDFITDLNFVYNKTLIEDLPTNTAISQKKIKQIK